MRSGTRRCRRWPRRCRTDKRGRLSRPTRPISGRRRGPACPSPRSAPSYDEQKMEESIESLRSLVRWQRTLHRKGGPAELSWTMAGIGEGHLPHRGHRGDIRIQAGRAGADIRPVPEVGERGHAKGGSRLTAPTRPSPRPSPRPWRTWTRGSPARCNCYPPARRSTACWTWTSSWT